MFSQPALAERIDNATNTLFAGARLPLIVVADNLLEQRYDGRLLMSGRSVAGDAFVGTTIRTRNCFPSHIFILPPPPISTRVLLNQRNHEAPPPYNPARLVSLAMALNPTSHSPARTYSPTCAAAASCLLPWA